MTEIMSQEGNLLPREISNARDWESSRGIIEVRRKLTSGSKTPGSSFFFFFSAL